MKLPLRTAIFWIHLALGLTAGLVILVMSVTGVLLMYERQITEWADRGYRAAPPSPGAERLPVETLLSRVLAARPEATPASVILQADPAAPATVSLGRRSQLFVNPYTGEILGEGSQKVRKFFHAVTDWHRWLGAADDNRDGARAVTGASNLVFLFLVVSGLYLWVPRKWVRTQLRNVTWFRGGLSAKARDFNWHNVFGFWMAIPLFFVVASAVVISYPWAGNLIYRAVGEEPPVRSGPPGGQGAGPGRARAEGARREGGPAGERPSGERRGEEPGFDRSVLQGLDPLWARAERQVADWQTLSLRLPESADAPVTFTINRGHRGRPDLRSQLTLDRARGEVVTWEPFASQSLGRRLRTWTRWIHTGEAGGVLGQTLAGIASAAGAVLVWTGFALAWRRLVPKRQSKKQTLTAEEADTAAPSQAYEA
ncbi:MAG TPA: PepSY-associated TM helix domain-containing protein [Thermoanaerobaculia bacterium]|nr:PepSY-associated TM helix domain-containing protein [Thermoanaerobaculia bacterium]